MRIDHAGVGRHPCLQRRAVCFADPGAGFALQPRCLVVDDGSTDGTSKILDRTPGISVIRQPENRGYGQSMIESFRFAQREGYEWLITMDCDNQHEPARIPMFVERAERCDADIISGSRYLLPMPENTLAPEDRRLINMRITRLINETLGLSLTDSFCGFKAYRVEAVASLPLSEPGYAFPLQFWVQAVHNGLSICEYPIPLVYHDATRSFGGTLDDPEARYQHYLDVFHAELAKVAAIHPPHAHGDAEKPE